VTAKTFATQVVLAIAASIVAAIIINRVPALRRLKEG